MDLNKTILSIELAHGICPYPFIKTVNFKKKLNDAYFSKRIDVMFFLVGYKLTDKLRDYFLKNPQFFEITISTIYKWKKKNALKTKANKFSEKEYLYYHEGIYNYDSTGKWDKDFDPFNLVKTPLSLRVLDLIDESEFRKILKSFLDVDRYIDEYAASMIIWLFKNYTPQTLREYFFDEEIKNRSLYPCLIAAIISVYGNVEKALSYAKNPKDILRACAILSGFHWRDIKKNKFNISRAHRKLIIKLIEKANFNETDYAENRKLWKKLISRLHPFSYDISDNLKVIFQKILKNRIKSISSKYVFYSKNKVWFMANVFMKDERFLMKNVLTLLKDYKFNPAEFVETLYGYLGNLNSLNLLNLRFSFQRLINQKYFMKKGRGNVDETERKLIDHLIKKIDANLKIRLSNFIGSFLNDYSDDFLSGLIYYDSSFFRKHQYGKWIGWGMNFRYVEQFFYFILKSWNEHELIFHCYENDFNEKNFEIDDIGLSRNCFFDGNFYSTVLIIDKNYFRRRGIRWLLCESRVEKKTVSFYQNSRFDFLFRKDKIFEVKSLENLIFSDWNESFMSWLGSLERINLFLIDFDQERVYILNADYFSSDKLEAFVKIISEGFLFNLMDVKNVLMGKKRSNVNSFMGNSAYSYFGKKYFSFLNFLRER